MDEGVLRGMGRPTIRIVLTREDWSRWLICDLRSDITWSFGGKRYRQAAGRIRDFALGGHGLLDFATDLDRA